MKYIMYQKGVTLIELLVVLGIMALFLSVVTPYLPNVIESTRIKTAARDLVTALKAARDEARIRQAETTFTLDVEKAMFQVGDRATSLKLPDETELTLITAESERIGEHRGRIRFFPDGSSTGGRVVVQHLARNFEIDVNWLTGRVAISP